jgi:hypothetical protein
VVVAVVVAAVVAQGPQVQHANRAVVHPATPTQQVRGSQNIIDKDQSDDEDTGLVAQALSRSISSSHFVVAHAGGGVEGQADVDDWVARMLQCVELERAAEVAAATEAATLCSPETAQARGAALLNLRVSELEGGLLGRTLITLVSNKGWSAAGGLSGAPPLPPHKFGTHDVVAIRPHKGATDGGAPLCSGEIATSVIKAMLCVMFFNDALWRLLLVVP